MDRDAKFAVIQFAAHPARNERLNVGLVVFNKDSLDVRLSKRLDRIRTLSAALDVDQVRSSLTDLNDLDAYARSIGAATPAERLVEISSLAPVQFSSLGSFHSPSTIAYENAIAFLLQKLVEPEPALLKPIKGRPSRLLTTLKRAFRQERVLARKGEDIDSHRILAKYPVGEGSEADLVLKNGLMHVLQIVDASAEDASVRRIRTDIALSAMLFEQARMTFGETETRARLIYQASSAVEAIAAPALHVAEHQGAELINWESNDDRIKFIHEVSSLATPIPDKKAKDGTLSIHASAQHKFLLN
jgi:Protein of unknown function (DUF3037)